VELREFLRVENDLRLTGRRDDRLLHSDAPKRCAYSDACGGCSSVLDRYGDIDISAVSTRQRQIGDDLGIEQPDGPMREQLYGPPQPRVTVPNTRYPVPAFGCDEGWAIDGKLAPVLADAAADRLLVAARRGPRRHSRRRPGRGRTGRG
jgi:hypothetical protein